MSDHAWVQEHIAAAVADGLTPEESERLNAHVRDCPECSADLALARTADRRLRSLFNRDWPGPALEDRAIRSLHAAAARKRRLLSGWRRKLAVGVAASVGLTVTGAGVSWLAGRGGLPEPSQMLAMAGSPEPEAVARASKESTRLEVVTDSNGPTLGPYNTEFTGGYWPGFNSAFSAPMKVFQAPADPSNPTPNFGKVAGSTFNIGNIRDGAGDSVFFGEQAKGGKNGGSDYFSTWGTSAYARNGAVHLQVDKSVTDGVPAPAYGIMPSEAPNHSSSLASLAGSQAKGIQTSESPPSPAKAGKDTDFRTPINAPTRDIGGEYPGQRLEYPALRYANPSDLADRKPAPEKPQSGEKAAYEKLLAAETGKGEKAAAQEFVNSTSPAAVPVLPPVDAPPPQKGDGALPPEKSEPPAKPASPTPAAEPAGPRKIVIRSGEIEFEVESFDAAVAAVTKLVTAIDGAFVATINSEKLPNGKVKGSVVLRVPPDRLDTLVLDLRKDVGKAGELKGQRIGSQDITKQYTDLESRLKAARTMEQRLLQIIKEGKGEIKQLLEVEKELGTWRTKIEEYEGELRYFGNQVALSTLTVTLAEREIRSAVAMAECERVQAGVEVEDVEKALQDALAAVTEAKGRVTKSELKQLAAGQFNATLHCELAPTAAGPFRDRLKQLGRMARLDVDRVLQSEGGVAVRDAKVTRGDTQFLVQFYNLANIAPRETTTALIAVPDVPAAYRALRAAIDKARGRLITSKLEEQDRLNVTAQLDFEVRRADEVALLAALNTAGEVVSQNVARAADGDNLTDSKTLFRTSLVSAVRVRPREMTALAVEVPDVDAAVAVYGALVAEAKGRTVDSQTSHERAGRDTAQLVYDVPLSAAASLVEKFKTAGAVRAQHAVRDLQAPDGRYATARIEVKLANVDPIVARDDGLWPQVRRGLSVSVAVLLTSVTWAVFGLCVVLPWAVIGYGGYRLFRRLAPRPAVATPVTPPAPPAA
jgi:hypothetical protein